MNGEFIYIDSTPEKTPKRQSRPRLRRHREALDTSSSSSRSRSSSGSLFPPSAKRSAVCHVDDDRAIESLASECHDCSNWALRCTALERLLLNERCERREIEESRAALARDLDEFAEHIESLRAERNRYKMQRDEINHEFASYIDEKEAEFQRQDLLIEHTTKERDELAARLDVVGQTMASSLFLLHCDSINLAGIRDISVRGPRFNIETRHLNSP